ncbi:helix-turn-helix domain-containing protein [Dactylosporangium sp. NPDC000555]|uniref:helix-turn-helix transcriptional regulator n=1 Tax=Dactylosporangium sp. NPDC000555 TaxID=3154260 RepID=UPI003322D211
MTTVGRGPSSEVPDTARHRALSAVSRVRMLDLVRRAGEGMTAAEVVDATGLHPSTVRAHLDQLVESGLLTRHRRGDGSPGRPAWRYQAAAQPGTGEAQSPSARPYRDLAAALIGHLARDADDPHAAGVRAGRDWGRALAAPLTPARAEDVARTAPVDGLVRVLDGLGFTPEVVDRPAPGSAVVHLRSCPFLDLALANPDVVCGVHHGVIGGALGALGASGVDTELQPFAVPGACVIRVHTGERPDR